MATQGQPVAAEAPDGTVFYADGQVVMVVSGNSAAADAEHPGAKVLGLGASSSNGYEYAMLYAVAPGAVKPDVVATSVEPGTLTTDGTHAFFLVPGKNSLGASLMEATAAAGSAGSAHLVIAGSAPTQALVGFSQSQVVLYAQPDSLYTYTPGSATPATVKTNAGQPVWVAGTTSGLLFLTCAKRSCSTVTEVNQSTGASGQSVAVPASSQILLGPDPAVLGVESGHLHLVRLS